MNSSSSDEEAGGKDLGKINMGLKKKDLQASSLLFFEEEEDKTVEDYHLEKKV
jgi:hypothetical protein